MEIKLGVPIYFRDGERGPAVERVIIEPRLWEVTHLVTEPTAGVPGRKLVHISLVEGWAADRCVTRLTREALAALPDYVEERYTTPRQFLASARPVQPGRDQVPSTQVLSNQRIPAAQPPPSAPIELRSHALVQAVDGPVGRLEELLLGEINQIAYLGIREDNGSRLRVPVEWVAYLDPTLIRLAAEQAQLGSTLEAPAGNYLAESPADTGRQSK